MLVSNQFGIKTVQNNLGKHRFAAYVTMVFLVVGLIQLAGSLIFYQIIDRQTLLDDHARRVAELLVVGQRMHEIAPKRTGASMTTQYLVVETAAEPVVESSNQDTLVSDIAEGIRAWEPSLVGRPLNLKIRQAGNRKQDLEGSLRLDDATWLNFVSRDISTMWPVAWRAMVLTSLITITFLALGLVVLHMVNRPLRHLTQAAESVGEGRRVRVVESGPRDLRDLAHAMNAMQERIDRILRDQTTAYSAIGHDLRTPLSRLKVVSGMIEDDELADISNQSISEMIRLLDSLESYLNAQMLESESESLDLVDLLKERVSRYGTTVSLRVPNEAIAKTFREPLVCAFDALLQNAIQYSGAAEVVLLSEKDRISINIIDHGPGVGEEHFRALLEPFFRLDDARQRNTDGFGLGIPTAHRLLTRFGGSLTFSRTAKGGLTVHIQIPIAK